MAAAITAAEAGSQVILLEGKDRVGKKLLSTGNGRCNFSNDIMAADCYYDADPLFVETVLGKNCVAELLEWLKNATGWPSVHTYKFAIHKKTGKTLSELRKEYMQKNSVEE